MVRCQKIFLVVLSMAFKCIGNALKVAGTCLNVDKQLKHSYIQSIDIGVYYTDVLNTVKMNRGE